MRPSCLAAESVLSLLYFPSNAINDLHWRFFSPSICKSSRLRSKKCKGGVNRGWAQLWLDSGVHTALSQVLCLRQMKTLKSWTLLTWELKEGLKRCFKGVYAGYPSLAGHWGLADDTLPGLDTGSALSTQGLLAGLLRLAADLFRAGLNFSMKPPWLGLQSNPNPLR